LPTSIPRDQTCSTFAPKCNHAGLMHSFDPVRCGYARRAASPKRAAGQLQIPPSDSIADAARENRFAALTRPFAASKNAPKVRNATIGVRDRRWGQLRHMKFARGEARTVFMKIAIEHAGRANRARARRPARAQHLGWPNTYTFTKSLASQSSRPRPRSPRSPSGARRRGRKVERSPLRGEN